jgi:hypothetical protein
MKTSELTGAALDWAVARCEGGVGDNQLIGAWYAPSTDWAQGGPIIEREGVTLGRTEQKSFVGQPPWVSYRIEHLFMDEYEHEYQHGDTPLIAAMRCYVASKLGDNIDLPKELT